MFESQRKVKQVFKTFASLWLLCVGLCKGSFSIQIGAFSAAHPWVFQGSRGALLPLGICPRFSFHFFLPSQCSNPVCWSLLHWATLALMVPLLESLSHWGSNPLAQDLDCVNSADGSYMSHSRYLTNFLWISWPLYTYGVLLVGSLWVERDFLGHQMQDKGVLDIWTGCSFWSVFGLHNIRIHSFCFLAHLEKS